MMQRLADVIKMLKAMKKIRNNPAAMHYFSQLKNLGQAMEKLYLVDSCRACSNAVVPVQRTARELEQVASTLDFGTELKAKLPGRPLFHHVFKISVSGCPNSCSQPQIKDFGLQGRARVVESPGACTWCAACVDACPDGAVDLSKEGPVLDEEKCLLCGRCARACPSEALVVKERGYTVLLGGKLGRHPRLARRFLTLAGEAECCQALDAVMEFYLRHGDGEQRLGSLLEEHWRDFQELWAEVSK